jgi:hypothetical protein
LSRSFRAAAGGPSIIPWGSLSTRFAFTAARRQGEIKEAEAAYAKWLEAKKQGAWKSRYSDKKPRATIQALVAQRIRIDKTFNRFPEANKVALAKLRLQNEIEETFPFYRSTNGSS